VRFPEVNDSNAWDVAFPSVQPADLVPDHHSPAVILLLGQLHVLGLRPHVHAHTFGIGGITLRSRGARGGLYLTAKPRKASAPCVAQFRTGTPVKLSGRLLKVLRY